MNKKFLGYPNQSIINWLRNKQPVKKENMLKFTSNKENSTILLQNVEGTYKTSTTGEDGSWTNYELGTLCTLTNIGDSIYFRAADKNTTCYKSGYADRFKIKGEVYATGNIAYLLDSTGQQLSIPAQCYYRLFQNCTGLYSAPLISADQLNSNCFNNMFQGCTNLSSISAYIPSRGTNNNWVVNVASNGNFYCNSTLPEIYGNSNIPENWNRITI